MSSAVQKTKRVGRPRGFDQDHVVARALDRFWIQGLADTSYDDLTTSTGLHRPSVHAAFGDKRGLFLATLAGYLRDSAAMMVNALSRSTLTESLDAFFSADIALFTAEGEARGCYALGAAAEAGRNDAEIAELERSAWRHLYQALTDRVSRARNELPPGIDVPTAVDLIVATHVTLALRARAGEPAQDLRARADRFLRLFSS